jgi:hypothetical protein
LVKKKNATTEHATMHVSTIKVVATMAMIATLSPDPSLELVIDVV